MRFTGQVVQRCPGCGVEHDVTAPGACEACHARLRYWCRRHGAETGWLPTSACPRCAEGAPEPAQANARSAVAAAPPESPAEPLAPAEPAAVVPPQPAADPQPAEWVDHLLFMGFLAVLMPVAAGLIFTVAGVVMALTAGGGIPVVVNTALSGASFGVLMGLVLVLVYVVIHLTDRRT
jgi:hypothetical protein